MYLSTLLVYFLSVFNCLGSKQSGQYKTTVVSIGPCDVTGTNQIEFKTRLSKVNKTMTCYSGWLSLPFGLTDEIKEHWDISVRGSTGGWKKNFISLNHKHACSDTKKVFPQWFKLLEQANLTDTSCPIPKGNYSFGCLDLTNIQFERASVMFFGRYRVTINYYLNKTLIGCTKYEGVLSQVFNSTASSSSSSSSSLVSSRGHSARDYERK